MVFLRTHQPYSGTEVLMETKLERIAEISANSPRPEFTSLYHLINKEMLLQCHKELDGNKAVGVDEITKKEYERNLEQNIDDLVERLKRKSYKPQPSIRVYIPKSNGKLRPLGIACYEDKIVQLALKKILEAIYEPRFLNCMYGFRPNRGCHEAIKEVYQRISYGKISYIVDADIKGFFDHIDHDWMMKFLEWNIQDKNLLWLIRKYLKAGIMEQGKFEPTEEGSAQGSVMSPMLANIYMHHVLTLWFKLVVQREMQGECFLVNFADDFVAGFQYKSEAERYYKELKERMEKFGLELESSKSRLIEFGRFAEQNRRARGECKPPPGLKSGYRPWYSYPCRVYSSHCNTHGHLWFLRCLSRDIYCLPFRMRQIPTPLQSASDNVEYTSPVHAVPQVNSWYAMHRMHWPVPN